MKVFVFPGQGAQFSGMGKELYESDVRAKDLFNQANDILGFDIIKIMFEGTAEELKQTNVTQPAIFLHSVALSKCRMQYKPDMVAGHSLGEFSALVAADALSFEDGLRLVSTRAQAMQKACEIKPSTMAAIIGASDDLVERVCSSISGIVVPANYNCQGQIVISGEIDSVTEACEKLKAEGAKRAILLAVGGAFHSPLMEPARQELSKAIEQTTLHTPLCPIYQNVDAKPHSDPTEIKDNLIKQLTAPVRWTQSVMNMHKGGATEFIELGPGNVLQGLIKKIAPDTSVSGFDR